MKEPLKLGSLFDGSGGFPLAGVINGVRPVWASEIEPYPLRVTEARFPDMIQLGDITKICGASVEPVDVITFGSPCQDLSVAGKQAGILNGKRSNLFFEAIRIIKEMRLIHGNHPRFAVWENVPGAFSSNKGEDFRAVLQSLCEIKDPPQRCFIPKPPKNRWRHAGCIVGDGYSIAWRLYDAQFWGVPQRRKRIYLIADFGGERAGEILFERESVRGNLAPGDEARKGIAPDAPGGIRGGHLSFAWANSGCAGLSISNVTAPTLKAARCGEPAICLTVNGGKISEADGHYGDVAPTIRANAATTYPSVCYGVDCRNAAIDEEKTHTLQAKPGGGFSLNCTPSVVYDARGNGDGVTVPTITGDHQNRITDYTSVVVNSSGNGIAATLDASYYKGPGARNGNEREYLAIKTGPLPRKYVIRRLTPLECCRLQGFPDWWEDGLNGCDSARYKMWGNGIALPCAVDVLRRVASAFD